MTHANVRNILTKAHNGKYALPAINISDSNTAIAAMEGLQAAQSPGFVQVTIGSAEAASRHGDPVEGTILLGRMLRDLRKQYNVPIIIHTDHCHISNVDRWLRPLLVELKKLKESGEPKIFDSFMFDGSMTDIHTNAKTIKSLLPLIKDVDGFLEVEAGGAWGGKEDGVGGGAKYSTPEDIRVISNAMKEEGLDESDYLLAVAFGNAHGTHVVPNLKPDLLKGISDETGEQYRYVFHGGSGSPVEDVKEAVKNGVVKMNVDTDTQYAYTNAIQDYELDPKAVDFDNMKNVDQGDLARNVIEAASRLDFAKALDLLKDAGPKPMFTSHKDGKVYFDPRKWEKHGREGMAKHVVGVATLLGSTGKAPVVEYVDSLEPLFKK